MKTKLANRVFTWSNNQDNTIFAAIDRVFSSTNWDAHFPLTTLCALPRVGSDHSPLLLDTGENNTPTSRLFRFEKLWFSHPEFITPVHKIWNTPYPFDSAIDTWQFKTKLSRQKVRGWTINMETAMKRKKI